MHDELENLAWLILFLPLLAAAVITLVHAAQSPRVSAQISIAAVVALLSCCQPVAVLCDVADAQPLAADRRVNWLSVGRFAGRFRFAASIALSLLMMLIVTGVGSLIHIYSWGYMQETRVQPLLRLPESVHVFDARHRARGQFSEMFIFWELVGVSSYLLIGFWYEQAVGGGCRKESVSSPIGSATSVSARHPDGLGHARHRLNFDGLASMLIDCSPKRFGAIGDRCRAC